MLNKTLLEGRLTRDPEIKSTGNEVEVCNYTVAWSRKIKEKEIVLFLKCTSWRQQALFVHKYFKKGDPIVIEGELSTEKYMDKDGNNRSDINCTVDKVHFSLGKSASAEPLPAGFEEVDSSDLPF